MTGEQRGNGATGGAATRGATRKAARLGVIFGGAVAAFAGLVALAGPAHAAKSDTGILLDLANQERGARGLAPLAFDAAASRIADAHCRAMKEQDRLFHKQDLESAMTGWSVLGENVGVGRTVRKVHDAFMASTVHRGNLLNPKFRFVGLCALRSDDAYWVTQVFFDRVGVANMRNAALSPSTPRRPTNVAATVRSSVAVARATVMPAWRRLPRITPPVAPASRSITQLARLASLEQEQEQATAGAARAMRGANGCGATGEQEQEPAPAPSQEQPALSARRSTTSASRRRHRCG